MTNPSEVIALRPARPAAPFSINNGSVRVAHAKPLNPATLLLHCSARWFAILAIAMVGAVSPLSAQTYTFTTIAGLAGSSGSADGTGTTARFNNPVSIAVDTSGNLYAAEWGNDTLRKITSGGVVTTLAGLAGSPGSVDGTGTLARFNQPFGVAVDGSGNVYVADYNNQTIRKVTAAGVVTTLAGAAGIVGWVDATGSAARFNQPFGVAVDTASNVYVGEYNQTIRKVTAAAVVTTLAGSVNVIGSADGAGTLAQFNYPERVAVDSAGNVYISDKVNHTIRKMTSAGVVSTLAGAAGVAGSADGTGTAARFNLPVGVAVDSTGNVYVADTLNYTIRKITSAGVVTTLAGSAGNPGSTDGSGSVARFSKMFGVAVDSAGNIYVPDYDNHTIRKGIVGSVPGISTQPLSQTAQPAAQVTFNITATGTPAPTYQWQRQPAGSSTWSDLTNGSPYIGVTTSSLLITSVTSAMGGDQFRCIATNTVGTATSNAATLYVPALSTPVSRSILVGQSASFSSTLTGAPSSPFAFYQWYRLPVGGEWTAVTASANYSGQNGPGLTVSGATLAMSGDQFKLSVSDTSLGSLSYVVDSLPATLTVGAPPPVVTPPAIVSQPQSQSVIESSSGFVTFTIAASGSPAPTYQWQRLLPGFSVWADLANGGNVSQVTTPSLLISGPNSGMSGQQFRCVVTNSAGTATSGAATLTVLRPSISGPASQTIIGGGSATFSVTLSNAPVSPSPSFQWQRLAAGTTAWGNLGSGANYAGTTSPTLVVSGATVPMSGDQFRVNVTNNSTFSLTSSAATLTVTPLAPPVFTQQPSSFTGVTGQTATFSVAVSGDPVPALQWQVSTDNGGSWQNIAGATGTSLSVPSISVSMNGRRYRAVATTATGGSSTSSAASLTVTEPPSVPPSISAQPVGGTFRVGQTATLTVALAGTGPFEYRWFKNGTALGSAGATLNLGNLQESDGGSYFVEVSSAGGKTSSQAATIVVQSPPRFVSQPLDTTVEKGLNASFSVVAAGSPTPTLQWYGRIGAAAFAPLAEQPPYSGTKQAILRISSADTGLDGLQLQVRATSAAGAIDSAIATLRVAQPAVALKIKTQPQGQSVKAGANVQFFVEMEGAGALLFQWRKDGSAMADATQSALSLPNVAADSAAGYSVVVRDSTGGIVTSNTASLTVVGAVDTSFDPKSGPNGPVTVMIALSDGGYLSAGAFTRVAGLPRAGLARFLRDGTVVAEFDPGTGPSGGVRALVELAGGKFLVVGQFDRFNGVAVPGVVRLNSQGGVDATFNPVLPPPPANDPIPLLDRFNFAAIGLGGGGYLLGGQAGVVALTPSGASNPSSLYTSNGPVFALLQQFNGGLILGGDFTSFGGSPRPRLVRLQPDLRIDSSFDVGTGPNAAVESLLRSPEGWIYVFGTFNSFNGRARPAGVARIGPTGALDVNYNPPLGSVPRAASVDPSRGENARAAGGRLEANNGIILPNGGVVPPPSVTNAAGTQKLAAVSPTGAVSATFDVSVNGAVNALAVSSDEAVTVAGNFSSISGTERANLGVVTDDSAGSRVVNLSTRGRVSGGDRNLILGFVIKGSESMRVLIRGVGPTLRAFGITSPLARPQLTVYDASSVVVSENRGWRTAADPEGLAQIMKQVGAFDLGSPDDTAIMLNLAPGNYTAQISGQSGGQGIALGEVYAVDQGNSRLINLSVRGAVGTGDEVLIPAFVVTGGSRLLLMRTVGPGLVQFGVSGTLARPSMELRNSTGILETNQGWTNSFDPAALQARTPLVGAFPLSAQSVDAAVLTALDAGAYTVTAKGADGGTGIALVEIYDANGVEKPTLTP